MKLKKIILVALTGILFTGSFAQDKKNASNQHPQWSSQSNIYEVNLRQYTASSSIRDFEKHLPRLKKMGVEILWFMPVTPIGKTDRKATNSELGSYYAVRDYKAINEEFGTMDDFKLMVKNAHAMGFKVITDWVANHSSTDNRWIKDHPDFYAKDSSGKVISAFDWTDTYKLDFKNRELRDSMIDAMKFWLTETGIDGFRCDVAGEVPDDFWKECIQQLLKVKHVFMLAEGEKTSLHDVGFDATYTWSVMGAMGELYTGKKTLLQFDTIINKNIASYPADAYRMYFTTNHDENSWNGTEFEKYGDAYKTFAVFSQTMYQSIPLIYSGQEEPNKRRLKFFVKDTIEWNQFLMAPFYETLLKLRKSTPALAADASYKRLKTSNDEYIFSFLREKNGRKVAVILNLSGKPQKFTINDKSIAGKASDVFLKQNEKLTATKNYSLEPWGYIVYDFK